LLGDSDITIAPYAAAVTVRTGRRGEILMGTSQLINIVGWGYVEAI
jgi:hypothetical protein